MQEYREPLFTKGRVVKKESLEALRDFPGRLCNLALSGWADGVLDGFSISHESGCLLIGEGAVWQEGHIVLAEAQKLPFTRYDQPVIVRLRLLPRQQEADYIAQPFEFFAEPGEPEPGEIELGRFCLSEGARLRREYRDLRDFRTAYNTLDITRVPYAGPGGVTVSPVLLQAFARTMLANNTGREMDLSFAFQCLNHTVGRECLLWYLSKRLGEPYQELDAGGMYERLVRIAGMEKGHGEERRRKEGPAVL